jgi:K+/H+ antiporter YhaU regulatory subunit KhtT
VREIRIGVVDAGDEAQVAAVEEALEAAIEPLPQRRMHAEACAGQRDRLGDLQRWAQVGVARVGVARDQGV